MAPDEIISYPSFFESLLISKASKTYHPPFCYPLYSFWVVYVLFEAGTVRLDEVFEMWSHRRAIKRYEDLPRQACKWHFYEVQHSDSFIDGR